MACAGITVENLGIFYSVSCSYTNNLELINVTFLANQRDHAWKCFIAMNFSLLIVTSHLVFLEFVFLDYLLEFVFLDYLLES